MSPRGAPPPNAPDGLSDDERARFAAALATLGVAATSAAPLVVAVSGGPDSMAMLTLAAATLPGAVFAATVDHRLRAEAADEALAVARHCARVGVPHATLVPATPITGASLQARARDARYALLADEARRIGAVAIATAHHADDAAETFLMRAARGSGLAGLAGVRPRTIWQAEGGDGIAIVRPLLDWRRAELRAVVRRAGIPFIDDPANRDERHDRTRFRRLLAENEWLDPSHLAQSAAALAAADAEMRALADWAWDNHAVPNGTGVRIEIGALPRELRRRLVRRAIGMVRDIAAITAPSWSDSANVEPLLDALAGGHRSTQAGVVVTPSGTRWRFAAAPPRRTAPSRV